MNDNNGKKAMVLQWWNEYIEEHWHKKRREKKPQYITTYDADTKIWGYNISDQDEER